MKNRIKTILAFGLMAFLGLQTINAQYRLYNICQNRIKAGDHLLINGNDIPLKSAACPDPTGNPPQIPGFPRPPAPPSPPPASGEEFPFELYFNDIGVLLALQSAIDAAQRAAVDEWLGQQEETFRQEINRQLGTNHGNFRDAQRDFFKNYEKNELGLLNNARERAGRFSRVADNFDTEQITFSKELYFVERWELLREWCGPHQTSECQELAARRVQGTLLGNVTNDNQLADLKELAIVDFSRREYLSALNRSWSKGLWNSINSDLLLDQMVNNHIGYYDQRGLQDKVFLMTAYLTKYNLPGPVTIPSRYLIPDFWDNPTLDQIGKDNAPALTDLQKSFQEDYIWKQRQRCYSIHPRAREKCHSDLNELVVRKNEVIEEHVNRAEKIIQDEQNRENPLNLNDPCGNSDLQNKELSKFAESLINGRNRIVSVPRGGTASIQELRQQKIEDGVGKVNLDRYELNITKLPNGFNAKSLFEYIRRNFSDFATGDGSITGTVEFEPYSDRDERTWNSDNPIGSAMDFNTLFDTATVVLTEYDLEELFWTFTTVHSFDHRGHPVSGHRQFGLSKNQNGSYTFYLRGADRLTSSLDAFANRNFPSDKGEFAFELADKSWKSLMKNLEKFIIDSNGRTIKFDTKKEYGRRHNYRQGECK